MGVAETCVRTGLNALFAPFRNRELFEGIRQEQLLMGAAVGYLVGYGVVRRFGIPCLPVLFFLEGVIVIICSYKLMTRLKPFIRSMKHNFPDITLLIRSQKYVMWIILFVIANIATYMIGSYLTLFLTIKFNIRDTFATLGALYAIPVAIGTLMATRLSALSLTFNKRKLFLFGSLTSALSLFGFLYAMELTFIPIIWTFQLLGAQISLPALYGVISQASDSRTLFIAASFASTLGGIVGGFFQHIFGR